MSNFYHRPSRRLTVDDAKEIIRRLHRGDYQHHIAADYGVNQGRISDINTSKTFPELDRPWKNLKIAA